MVLNTGYINDEEEGSSPVQPFDQDISTTDATNHYLQPKINEGDNNKTDVEEKKEKKEKKKKKKKKKKLKDGEEEKEEEEEEETAPPIPFFQLFRYATSFEKLLSLLGIMAAMAAGLCMPGMVILFGRLTNAFVYNDLNLTEIIEMNPELENKTEEELADYLHIGDFNKQIQEFGVGNIIIGIIMFITGYIFVTTLNYAAEGQVFRLRSLFLKSILKQEIGWFDTHRTNNFASRVSEDLNKVQEGIGEKVGMFVFFTTTFIFSIINAFVHGWQLTLVVLTVFPILGIVMGMITKLQTSLTSSEMKEYAKAGSIAEEVFSSIRTVIPFGGEKAEIKRYEANLVQAKEAGIKRGMMTGVGVGLMWLIMYASYAIAFWYGTKLILDSRPPNPTQSYDPNDLIVVFFSVLMGAMNMGQSAPYIEAFGIARGAAGTIYEIIERQSAIDPTSKDGDKPNKMEGTIEFKDVFFTYPSRPDVKILEGVSLKINPGETVALVGSSGCGKSTCIQLVQRFYDPHSGKVLIDDKDIRSLNIGWLRDQIGVVGQEPVLFATTVAENIRHGKEDASFGEIQEAAKKANVHGFIMSLPKKYETQVGERGVQMSGGQKQRIAIARALLKHPKVLLLDEATSALDNESEAVVQRALDKASKGRTTIIVAHRLSTIRSASLILALKEGRVVERGTHDQLMEKDGFYKGLVTTQVAHRTDFNEDPIDTNEVDSDTDAEIVDEFVFQSPIPLGRSSIIRSSTKRRRSSNLSKKSKASSHASYISHDLNKKKKKKKKKKEDDEDSDYTPAPLSAILKLNKPETPYIIVGVIGSAIQGCMMPGFAVLFGNVLGTLALSEPEEVRRKANLYSLLFLVLGIIAAVSMFLQAYMFSLSGEILTMRLRKRAFSTMLRQEIGWYDQDCNSVGSLCSRLSGDASAVQGATGSRVGAVVQSVTTLVFSIALAMVYSAKLGAVMLPFIPFIIVGVYIQAKVVMGQSVTELKVLEKAGKIAIESITNIRTVASLHKEEHFATTYSDALLEPHLEAQKTSHVRGLAFGFAQSIIFFAYSAVMFYGGHLVDIGELEFEEVFKVAEALILGTMVVGQAMAFAPNYSKARVAASKMISLFDRVPLIDSSTEVGIKMKESLEQITLKDVIFQYPTRPNLTILKGMNVEVKKGQKVALVGSSGCGKSTIINLLERFYDAKGGEVLLNKTNIQQVNVHYARSMFGLVSQEPVLFDRTISENIAYGNNDRTFSQEDIEEVAKQANIHDFVQSLPNGYNTSVGSKGTQLSGGQKQRIAIARALVRNPQVLLLDEATSALDAESEKIVQETLERVLENRTSITIAHRLSTIKDADKIFVVKGGIIVEEGTHNQLICNKRHYWKLYNASA